MNNIKLILDIVVGAVIPAMVLKWGTKPMGEITAYVVAAFIPVAYVVIELMIRRKLNVITLFLGLSAVVNGALVFWFVDGWKYALKDSAASLATVLLLAGSAMLGRPLVAGMLAQAFGNNKPASEDALKKLMRMPSVHPQIQWATWGLAGVNLLLAVINYFLNVQYVTAVFPSEEFNNQKANLDFFTRFAFPIVSLGLTVLAGYAAVKALIAVLPGDDGLGLPDRLDLLDAQANGTPLPEVKAAPPGPKAPLVRRTPATPPSNPSAPPPSSPPSA